MAAIFIGLNVLSLDKNLHFSQLSTKQRILISNITPIID